MASKTKRKAKRASAKKQTKAKKRTTAKRTKAKARVTAKGRGPAKKAAPAKKPAPAKKRAPAKKQTRKVEARPASRPLGPVVLDELLEEPLLDASTILRVQDRVARSRRDVDEDELEQFPDPSLVVEAATRDPRRAEDDTEKSSPQLSELFAAEARRQKERDRDDAAAPAPRDGSLFGLDDEGED